MIRRLAFWLQGISELSKRYGTVIQRVWRQRKALDPPPRCPHELQFLPAALELADTPVSPAPRTLLKLIAAFSFLAILWACVGEIDVVATAQGRIVPNDRTKVIQPLEAAVVKAIRISDGQAVRSGEVLIELDATTTAADVARISNDLTVASYQAARSRAILAAIASGTLPSILQPTELPASLLASPVPAERLAQERRMLEAQYRDYQAKLSRLDAEIGKREAELRSTAQTVHKLEQTVPIVQLRASDLRALLGKRYASKHDYLEKEQTRLEQEGELAIQRSRMEELQAAIEEGRGQRTALIAETQRTTMDSLHEAEQKAATAGQELIKAEIRQQQTTLRAPVDGMVQQLVIHTVGGIVTPAQQLMMIVPHDHPLEIEAFIENKDVGFVKTGQEAEVKIETFPFTKYGTIHGRVTSVSHDAINDDKRGLIYSTRVKPARAVMDVDGTEVRLGPGMAVSVEIKTSKRRVIEYFLSPLIQYQHESLRER